MTAMKPQHFDILGVCAFLYVVGFATLELMEPSTLPTPALLGLLLVGLAGLIVDSVIVYRYFIRKGKD